MKSTELPTDSENRGLNPNDEYDPDLIAEAEAIVAGCDKAPDQRKPWEIELEEILAGPNISVKGALTVQETSKPEHDRGFFDGVRFSPTTPKFESLDLTESHNGEEIENIFVSLADIINKLPTPEIEKLNDINPHVKFCRSGDTIVIFDPDCCPDPIFIVVQFTQSKPGKISGLVPICSSIEEIHRLKSRDSDGNEIEIGHNSNSLYMDRITGQMTFNTSCPNAKGYGSERSEFLYMQLQREIRVLKKLLMGKKGI